MSSTCPHNMVNFGLLTAEIHPVVWGTPANFNGFRVLAGYGTASSSGRQPNCAALNRGRHLCLAGRPMSWELAYILVIHLSWRDAWAVSTNIACCLTGLVFVGFLPSLDKNVCDSVVFDNQPDVTSVTFKTSKLNFLFGSSSTSWSGWNYTLRTSTKIDQSRYWSSDDKPAL